MLLNSHRVDWPRFEFTLGKPTQYLIEAMTVGERGVHLSRVS